MQPSITGHVIVASKTDPASLNMFQSLIKYHNFRPTRPDDATPTTFENQGITLIIVEKDGIYVQPEDVALRPSSVIFASKHRSSTNTPALTVHATGNLTHEALYGGNPEQISLVEPFTVREALTSLNREVRDASVRIEVTLEATHHGPTNFPVPVCFVEIGSDPGQWQDPVLGRIAATAIMCAARASQSTRTSAVGFGGTHYSDKLTQMCVASDYQIGHIVPRHAFDAAVSEKILQETFHKTVGVCKTAIVDWKGLKGDQRRTLLDRLAAWDVEVVRC